jgi:hypothetical protein
VFADARRYFQSLPRDQYPTVVELADDLTECDPDGLFEFGLEVWLRAIQGLARRGP